MKGRKGTPTLPTDGSTGLIAGTPVSRGVAETDEKGPAFVLPLPSAAYARNGSCVASSELGQSTDKQKGADNCGPAVTAKPQNLFFI